MQPNVPVTVDDVEAESSSDIPNANNTSDNTDNNTSTTTHINRNIPVTLWYQFLRCFGEGIWLTSVLSAYVYLLKPSNPELVGYLSALEGIT